MKIENENKPADEKNESGISDLSEFLDDIQNTLNSSAYSSSSEKKAPVAEKIRTSQDETKEINESSDFSRDFDNIFNIIKNKGSQETGQKDSQESIVNDFSPPEKNTVSDEDDDIKIYGGETVSDQAESAPEDPDDYFFDNIKDEIISSKNTQNAEQVMNIINDADGMDDDENNDYFGFERTPPPAKQKTKNAPPPSKKNVSAYEKAKNSILYKFSEEEYKSFDQNDNIFKQYTKYYGLEYIRLATCVILFLIEFYLEIAPFFQLKLPYVLDVNYYNTVYIPLNWQVLLITCAVMNKSIIYGFKSLIKNVVNIHSIASVISFLACLQTGLTYFIMYNKPGIRLYNSVVIGLFVFIAVSNILSIQKESLALKTICGKRSKLGVKTLKNTSHEAKCFSEYIHDDTKIGLSQVTSFVSNFFATTNKKPENRPLKLTLLIIISISVVIFGTLTIMKRDVYSSVSNIIFFILASVPFCATITAIYPFYNTQKKLKPTGAAIIGEDSIESYSNISVFSVYDKDIFPPELIKVSGIRIYGNNRIDSVLKCLCSLYDMINSPLYHVLKVSVNYDPEVDSKEIDIVDIKDNGICFKMNTKNFYVGNGEYISDLGLLIPVDENFDETFIKSSGNIMYFSTEDEIISKLYLKYELTHDFADIIKNLARLNICLGIRTSDPNITNESIQKIVANKKTVISVIKLHDIKEKQIVEENLTTGIVSKNNVKSLIEALVSCNKTNNVIKTNMLVQTIAFIFGAVCACVMIFSGDITKISVLHLILLQMFWFVPVLLLSNLTPH